MRATMAFTHKHNPRTLVIWCPGQYADQMDAEGLRQCSTYWHWLVANAHEVDHIRAHAPDILKDKTVITTHGSAPLPLICLMAAAEPLPCRQRLVLWTQPAAVTLFLLVWSTNL